MMAGGNVCPWWLGYFLLNPLRRLVQDPAALVGLYVKEGMTVVEPGPGMGFFTLELAKRVGASGRVIAVDIQDKMLAKLRARAGRANLQDRIETRLAQTDSLGLTDLAAQVDVVFAFAVVHEMTNVSGFFQEAAQALKIGACLVLVEPTAHTGSDQFAAELAAAKQAGFEVVDRPSVRLSQAVVLKKAG
jgi:Methylase involved in ubiquinone/menaquinone biosynthesis